MTVESGAPVFSDADVRRYLAARADAVASRAAPSDDIALRVAIDLQLVRPRRSRPARVVRLAVVVALLGALLAGALYLIGRFADDYAPDQPTLTVELHGSPWGVAALDGRIWAVGYQEPVLFEIDPSSGQILDEIPTGKPACGDLAAAYGYLWFTTCPSNAYLSRLDPDTGHIDRLNGYGGDRLAFGGGHVWVGRPGGIEGLDPTTLETRVRLVQGGAGLFAYGFDSLWISNADGGVVSRLDPARDEVLAEVTWAAGNTSPYPVYITEGDEAIWVVDEAALGVYRIDPATNAASRVDIRLSPIDGTGFGDHPITFGAGELWVREAERTIARIDTTSLAVAERITTEPFGGGAFVVTEDAFWYANLKGDSIVGLQRP